jgi:hypothetical protein
MYSTCLFCNGSLGKNDVIEPFPVGRRLAFDALRGRLWVICTDCHQWNLTPIEERWEAVDECERLFRVTRLRISTDNIGYARLREGLELVRIGKALRPEIAAWRYGDQLVQRQSLVTRGVGGVLRAGNRLINGIAAALGDETHPHDVDHEDDPLTRLRLYRQRRRVLDVTQDAGGRTIIIRYGDLVDASLIRPDPEQPWRLLVKHQGGVTTLGGESGLRTASKLLSTINLYGGTAEEVAYATAKVEDAENSDGYFARVFAIAMRTSWGRFPSATVPRVPSLSSSSPAERLALYVTNRSFWARGAIGSEPATQLLALPMVDRLALEMAAHEDNERRAMEGELAELEEAWREAEEIAEIADSMFDDEELALFKQQLLERTREEADPAKRLPKIV